MFCDKIKKICPINIDRIIIHLDGYNKFGIMGVQGYVANRLL